jgi:phosphatidylserine/phosphatidylglycerophosphate/cardiolipin synthase-like enzyme
MPRRWPWLLLLLTLLGCDNSRSLSVPGNGDALASANGQFGPVRVYFTRPGGSRDEQQAIVQALVGYIEQAKQSIDVAAFELDNEAIADALLAALKRGVRIRLVTETGYLQEAGTQRLKAAGVPVVDDQRDGALMHNKFMVFDDQGVWTGSMNFTENCAHRNNNHGVFIDDPRIATNYAAKFAWMFEQRKFGGLPNRTARIPNPVVTLRDGTVIENYFSTHDHIADRVVEKVGQAQTSIHFLAFSFTHDEIGRAMLERAPAGVSVQGVFEKSQTLSGYSEYARFRSAGPRVQVYLDANPRNMHHKVIILDGSTTVAGSFNFSDGADRQNDENVVIIKNVQIAKRFEEEFQRVFGAARKSETAGPVVSSSR